MVSLPSSTLCMCNSFGSLVPSGLLASFRAWHSAFRIANAMPHTIFAMHATRALLAPLAAAVASTWQWQRLWAQLRLNHKQKTRMARIQRQYPARKVQYPFQNCVCEHLSSRASWKLSTMSTRRNMASISLCQVSPQRGATDFSTTEEGSIEGVTCVSVKGHGLFSWKQTRCLETWRGMKQLGIAMNM